MIDFHCHIDLYERPAAIVEECERRGLHVLSVTTTPSAWRGTSALAADAKGILTALGLHPQLAHQRKGELPLFDQLLPNARFVGEIGLDGAPGFRPYLEDQLRVFRHILLACKDSGGKIMTLHSRRAATMVLDELEAHAGAGTPILHWFSGSMKELSRAIELGCWFSVGPVMLASDKGREIASRMPRDRVLTESDGPFARIGEGPAYPWDAASAVSPLAEIWNLTPDDVQQQLGDNLRTLVTVRHF